MRRIFWGFCKYRFLMSPLHYLSCRSEFGFEFAEIFLIEKRLSDSASRGFAMVSRGVLFEIFFKFIIDFPNFKRITSPKRTNLAKNKPGMLCTITIDLFKGLKKIVSIGNLVDSPTRRVIFRERISPRIRSENRNGSKGSVRDSRKSASLPCPIK